MSDVDAKAVAPALLSWWHKHGRKDLPWQQNPNRYRVWVSEIMLQQTQVTTVERYFDRFMKVFPDVATLGAADSDAVMHLWSGLGYYARARNLHKAAVRVAQDFDGIIPGDSDSLQSLPGIGRSTAGAILSLADNQPHPILDGNAKRVYARLFGVEGWPGKSAVLKALWTVAEACTPEKEVNRYTQAIMDLGATLCVRRNPRCVACPLQGECAAYKTQMFHEIPASKPKKSKPQRSTVMVLATRPDGSVLLEKRPDSGIWGGLWCLPEIKTVDQVADWCRVELGREPEQLSPQAEVRHSFTHFDLTLTPVIARLPVTNERVMDDNRWLWYNADNPASVGLAAPVARLLETNGEGS